MKFIIMLVIELIIISFVCYNIVKMSKNLRRRIYSKWIYLLIAVIITSATIYTSNSIMPKLRYFRYCIINKISTDDLRCKNMRKRFHKGKGIKYDMWTAYPAEGGEYKVYFLPKNKYIIDYD